MRYSSIATFLNTSPFVSGCVMLIMNLGGKYVMMDIPKGMHYFFEHPGIRKLTVFCIAFVATRNIKTALLVALIFILFSRFLMNETSTCCLKFVKQIHKTKLKKEAEKEANKKTSEEARYSSAKQFLS